MKKFTKKLYDIQYSFGEKMLGRKNKKTGADTDLLTFIPLSYRT